MNREDNRREVKKANGGLPNSLWDTYSSFANCCGGVIILGVKEEKDGSWRTTGLKNEAKLRKDFWDTINNPKKVNLVKIHSTCCKLSGMLYYKKYLSYCTVIPKIKCMGKTVKK